MGCVRQRVVFFHNDADGRCAAALAGRDALARGAEIVHYAPVDYGQPVPDLAQFGYSAEQDDLWLFDFSYKAHDMDKLACAAGQHQDSQVSRLVWIDHHVTSLKALEGFEWLPGVRYAGLAACMLTWRYLNGPDMPPWAR
jgi:oligoribonuclease NrnB/cAMP/cGMP phosphodiesterase (DHH superfamily)